MFEHICSVSPDLYSVKMSKTKEDRAHILNALSKLFNQTAFVVGQKEYEETIERLFNGSDHDKPKAIIRPKNTDDVCRVLKFAFNSHLKVSVLGGGHDPKGRVSEEAFGNILFTCGVLIVCQRTDHHPMCAKTR